MKVLILDTTELAIERAARIIAEQVAAKPRSVLGLATGGTMLPVYDKLRQIHSAENLSFSGITTFNLDEYVGLAPSHPASYHSYMRNCLFDHIDIDPARTFLPRGDAADPNQEAEKYEAQIAAAGGIDLQLLGIGRNGHIGFNEPTSSLNSKTRIKTLTASTREANRPYFAVDEETPKYALTMGIGTILAARNCLLLATGASKAEAVARCVEGPISAACPASALQLHPKATLVLDQQAASALELREYYFHVHPEGAKNAFE